MPAEAAVACDLSLGDVLPKLFHNYFVASEATLSVLLLHTMFAGGWLG